MPQSPCPSQHPPPTNGARCFTQPGFTQPSQHTRRERTEPHALRRLPCRAPRAARDSTLSETADARDESGTHLSSNVCVSRALAAAGCEQYTLYMIAYEKQRLLLKYSVPNVLCYRPRDSGGLCTRLTHDPAMVAVCTVETRISWYSRTPLPHASLRQVVVWSSSYAIRRVEATYDMAGDLASPASPTIDATRAVCHYATALRPAILRCCGAAPRCGGHGRPAHADHHASATLTNLAGRVSRCIACRSLTIERIIDVVTVSSRCLRLAPNTSRGAGRPPTGEGGGAGGSPIASATSPPASWDEEDGAQPPLPPPQTPTDAASGAASVTAAAVADPPVSPADALPPLAALPATATATAMGRLAGVCVPLAALLGAGRAAVAGRSTTRLGGDSSCHSQS